MQMKKGDRAAIYEYKSYIKEFKNMMIIIF